VLSHVSYLSPCGLKKSWRKCALYAIFIMAGNLSPQVVFAAPITLEYSLEKTGEFLVLYSRAVSNATGAALGGLIGASIQAGVENGKDKRKEEQVLEHLASSDCAPFLETSFLENLVATGDYEIVEKTSGKSPEDPDLKVELTIDRCGFKLVNSERMLIAAFAEARYRIYSPSESKPKKADRLLLLGKSRTTWDGLLDEQTEIPLRFERVLEKAGKRLANKVIYRR